MKAREVEQPITDQSGFLKGKRKEMREHNPGTFTEL